MATKKITITLEDSQLAAVRDLIAAGKANNVLATQTPTALTARRMW